MKTLIILDCFSKKDNVLVWEFKIPLKHREELSKLFNIDNLIGGSLVTDVERSFLEGIINKRIDLENYIYIFEEVEDKILHLEDCKHFPGAGKYKLDDEL